jgi:hypothetical protein
MIYLCVNEGNTSACLVSSATGIHDAMRQAGLLGMDSIYETPNGWTHAETVLLNTIYHRPNKATTRPYGQTESVS